jgi:hypothetical protein
MSKYTWQQQVRTETANVALVNVGPRSFLKEEKLQFKRCRQKTYCMIAWYLEVKKTLFAFAAMRNDRIVRCYTGGGKGGKDCSKEEQDWVKQYMHQQRQSTKNSRAWNMQLCGFFGRSKVEAFMCRLLVINGYGVDRIGIGRVRYFGSFKPGRAATSLTNSLCRELEMKDDKLCQCKKKKDLPRVYNPFNPYACPRTIKFFDELWKAARAKMQEEMKKCSNKPNCFLYVPYISWIDDYGWPSHLAEAKALTRSNATFAGLPLKLLDSRALSYN